MSTSVSNKIRLVRQERVITPWLVPHRFEFNAKGRMPWLQRVLLWGLKHLKAESFDMLTTYNTVTVDTTKILEAIMRNQRDVELLYNKRAKYVVMGHDAFCELTRSTEIHDMMRFQFDARVGRGTQTMIFGLECVIVPWIEGFFVLPDLESRN